MSKGMQSILAHSLEQRECTIRFMGKHFQANDRHPGKNGTVSRIFRRWRFVFDELIKVNIFPPVFCAVFFSVTMRRLHKHWIFFWWHPWRTHSRKAISILIVRIIWWSCSFTSAQTLRRTKTCELCACSFFLYVQGQQLSSNYRWEDIKMHFIWDDAACRRTSGESTFMHTNHTQSRANPTRLHSQFTYWLVWISLSRLKKLQGLRFFMFFFGSIFFFFYLPGFVLVLINFNVCDIWASRERVNPIENKQMHFWFVNYLIALCSSDFGACVWDTREMRTSIWLNQVYVTRNLLEPERCATGLKLNKSLLYLLMQISEIKILLKNQKFWHGTSNDRGDELRKCRHSIFEWAVWQSLNSMNGLQFWIRLKVGPSKLGRLQNDTSPIATIYSLIEMPLKILLCISCETRFVFFSLTEFQIDVIQIRLCFVAFAFLV